MDASVEMECAVLLGGYVAERRFGCTRAHAFERPWTSPDYVRVKDTLERYLSRQLDPSMQYLATSQLEDFTRSRLRRAGVWEAVLRLSDELRAARGVLLADRANALLDECLPGPWMPDGRHRDAPRRVASIIPLLA